MMIFAVPVVPFKGSGVVFEYFLPGRDKAGDDHTIEGIRYQPFLFQIPDGQQPPALTCSHTSNGTIQIYSDVKHSGISPGWDLRLNHGWREHSQFNSHAQPYAVSR